MPFIVSKFGGTSLANGERLMRAAAIVQEDPRRRLIVVSAPGKRDGTDLKITDRLIALHKNKSERLFDSIAERFFELAEAAGVGIEAEIKKIKKKIFAGADERYTVSRGEWLTAFIMAGALGFEMCDARDVILFEGGAWSHESYRRIQKRFSKGRGMVVPGFYGAEKNGKICLFPRGGGDITGAICAAAIQSLVYENWTDVDGVYEEDPAQNPEARKMDTMTFSDMRSLFEKGAHVLHPESLAPVWEKRVPVRVKNTFRPQETGTLLLPDEGFL